MRSFVLFFAAVLWFVRPAELFSAERSIPTLSGPVIDEANLLTRAENRNLDLYIRNLMPKVQAQIWIITSLEGEAIEALAIRAVDQWKLGKAKTDNGVLILVAKEDRQIRIEVGKGLEGDIPDAMAGRIIDRIIKPKFRETRFYLGLRDALEALDELAAGRNQGVLERKLSETAKEDLGPFGLVKFLIGLIFLFVVVLFPILSLFISSGRRGSNWSRGSGWSGGWGGGFGGGGFGGGGWSGGGGGFSGGGASGRW